MGHVTSKNGVKPVCWIPDYQLPNSTQWTFENVIITAYTDRHPTYEVLTWDEAGEEYEGELMPHSEAAKRYESDGDELPTVKQLMNWLRGN